MAAAKAVIAAKAINNRNATPKRICAPGAGEARDDVVPSSVEEASGRTTTRHSSRSF